MQERRPIWTAFKAAALAVVSTCVMSAGSLPGATTAGLDADARDRLHALAVVAKGDYSQAALQRAFGNMDPSMVALAQRFEGASPISTTNVFRDPADAPPPEDRFAPLLEGLSWEAAREINDAIPFTRTPGPAARPFVLRASAEDHDRALNCLTEAIYYEAGYEGPEGQAAVAQVILNRLRHPIYPKTICGVVYQGSELRTGCQFTFTCDGSLARTPVPTVWNAARQVAERALNGAVMAAVGNGTHYHADYVVPYWIPSLSKVAKVGVHIFYRWPGGLGSPAAFLGQYAGGERLVTASLPTTPEAAPEPEPAHFELATLAAVVEEPAPKVLSRPQGVAERPIIAGAPALKAVLPPPIVQREAAPAPLRQACVESTLGNCMAF